MGTCTSSPLTIVMMSLHLCTDLDPLVALIIHHTIPILYEVDSRLYLSAALEVLCTYHGLCMDEGVVGGSEAGTRTCSLGKQHVSMQDDREAVQNYLTS